ncbi:hypothetical protein NDR87_35610 [Nocardia sp. CDC159]|uniref:Uncharacterized protein n=1 Tax=Nocardia pulmonis TaxID=2951408 RepID=A0A9X2EIP0_9NOCA|nr:MULTISPECIES: hypothetical protein [Nocardia]MCM6778816.1 hypothetical protein [Nocardia pulmonis]MCM6791705.1 hypothetical protein [Nocardia sp. CDC159]
MRSALAVGDVHYRCRRDEFGAETASSTERRGFVNHPATLLSRRVPQMYWMYTLRKLDRRSDDDPAHVHDPMSAELCIRTGSRRGTRRAVTVVSGNRLVAQRTVCGTDCFG